MRRDDFEIELTDQAVDVNLNAFTRRPHAKFGGFIFIIFIVLLMGAAVLFLPGKNNELSMWRNTATAKNTSDFFAPLFILVAGTIAAAWFGFRWAAAAWPSDERFHCDRNALTMTRVPWLDFKNRQWKTAIFSVAEVSQLRFGAYASMKTSTIWGLRFLSSGKRHKALPGLEAPEAQKILLALQHLGCDVVIDKDLQKRVDEAIANRYGELPSTS